MSCPVKSLCGVLSGSFWHCKSENMQSLEAVTALPSLSNFFLDYPAKSHGTSQASIISTVFEVTVELTVLEKEKVIEEYLSLK